MHFQILKQLGYIFVALEPKKCNIRAIQTTNTATITTSILPYTTTTTTTANIIVSLRMSLNESL